MQKQRIYWYEYQSAIDDNNNLRINVGFYDDNSVWHQDRSCIAYSEAEWRVRELNAELARTYVD
jgi:hypothetical protein